MPKNSMFGNVMSLNQVKTGINFVDRANGSHIKGVVLRFVHSGGVPASRIGMFPSKGSPMSLTFLGRRDSTRCVFCGSCPGRHLSILFPGLRRSSVIVVNSCCTLGPMLQRGVLRLLSRTHRGGTVVCCSPGFHSSRGGRTVGLTPAVVRGLRCTSVMQNSLRSFFCVCNVRSTSGVCGSGVGFCYPQFVYATKKRGMSLHAGLIGGSCPVRPLRTIDAVKTNSGFGTKLVCKLLGCSIECHSLGGLGRTA